MVFLTLGFSLFACGGRDTEEEIELEGLELIAANLESEPYFEGSIVDSIELPAEYEGAILVWESSHPEVFTNEGYVVNRPYYEDGPFEVTLTVILTKDVDSHMHTFTINIAPYSESESTAKQNLQAAIDAIEAMFDGVVIDDDVNLPSEIEGANVTWTSMNEDIITHIGVFTQPYAHQSENVELKAEIVANGFDFTLNVLVQVNRMSAETSAAAIYAEFIDSIDWDGTSTYEDLDLPTRYNNAVITWTSSNTNFMNNYGMVNPPLYLSNPVPITVTASLSYFGSHRETHEFTVTIDTLPQASVADVRNLGFTSLATEWLLDDTSIDIHYMEQGGLPYVDIYDFLVLLDGGESQGAVNLERLDIIYEENRMIIENFVDNESYYDDLEDEPLMENVTYSITFDFEMNTITVSHFGFFTSFMESTQTDFGSGLSVYDYQYQFGGPVTFDMAHYRLEMVREGEDYLIPFHLANMLLSGSMYDIYYNGDALVGFDTYQRSDQDVRETLLDSTLDGEDIPHSVRLATYNYLVFSFDHFYGLKDDYGVETYYNYFSLREWTREGLGHYQTVFRDAYRIDDLHTSFGMTGPYQASYKPGLSINDLGRRTMRFYETFWELEEIMFGEESFYDYRDSLDGPPPIEYYDNGRIARVPVYGFTADTPDEFAAQMEEIMNNPDVETIIVDLVFNTGGIVGPMIQLLGYMTNDDIPIHNINTGDGTTTTAWYQSEIEKLDYNWYIMSSGMTYSAGNMMVQIAKEMGAATIIGEQSAGGAASIRTNILPSGAMIIMSSQNVSTNQYYESTEMGVEVNLPLSRLHFNTESRIVNLINDHLSEDVPNEE